MTLKGILTIALSAISALGMNATDFFSTERCDNVLTFGARLGVNTTNRTLSDKAFSSSYHHENWGTGFDIGFVANLNFRDFFTLQPGISFEGRYGSYVLMSSMSDTGAPLGGECAQAGNRESYNFTIPVMAVFGFNVTDRVRWTVEAGPYISFVMGSKMSIKRFVSENPGGGPIFNQSPANLDFGIKMGTGFQFLDHYYVGAHYLAGCIDAWENRRIGNLSKNFGGVTKGWVFTIGYNF